MFGNTHQSDLDGSPNKHSRAFLGCDSAASTPEYRARPGLLPRPKSSGDGRTSWGCGSVVVTTRAAGRRAGLTNPPDVVKQHRCCMALLRRLFSGVGCGYSLAKSISHVTSP